MESETPELLPSEKPKVPDPEAVAQKVTTRDAFGGKPPITKDQKERNEQGEES